MISCPSERELVELVEGDLAPDRTTDVLDHLSVCDDCCGLMARSEAALRYALGGLADTGAEVQPVLPETPVVAPRRLRRVLWTALASAAAVVVAVGLARDERALDTAPVASPPIAAPVPQVAPTLDARLDDLVARAERCLTPLPDEAGELLAGLEAAERARTLLAALAAEER